MQRGAATCAVACAERIGPPQECTGLCLPVDWGGGRGSTTLGICFLMHASRAIITIIIVVVIVVVVIIMMIMIMLITIRTIILSLRASRRPGPRVHPSLFKGF